MEVSSVCMVEFVIGQDRGHRLIKFSFLQHSQTVIASITSHVIETSSFIQAGGVQDIWGLLSLLGASAP